ncbi:MAG TPA: cytochrome c3 family protein, partial [Methyloceanibacter sp.]|nr:cytochrome c3 family protein [Methyloceanibacter sp.]
MKSSLALTGTTGLSRKARPLLLGILALALLVPSLVARAEGDELSKEDKACLNCHDKEGETKLLGNGEKLSLHISTGAYIASMHNGTSCEDCHSDIDSKTHGKVKTTLKSRRELTLSMKDACVTCHKKKVKEYGDSVHAAMIAEGSDKAPLCSDCHDPHTVRSVKIVQPPAATPCAKCHEDIFKAYAADVHGLERAAKGKAAPLCADCHQAHAVKAASADGRIKDACFGCHKNAVDLHKDWLPNTGRHFEAVSCPACHAPDAQRRVNLRMYDGQGKTALSEKTGVPKFERLASAADVNNMGLDERALWSLLKEISGDGIEANTVLRGRLEVRSGKEAHQISLKSRALRDCSTCHQQGAAAFQSVTLTIAG